MERAKQKIKILSWLRAFIFAAGIYAILGLIALLTSLYFSKDLPSIEQLQKVDPELVTRIYSADGVILQELFTQHRIYVSIDQIPPAMVQAVIAIEDSRFLRHWGVSLRDFGRAMIIDIITLSKKEGASTMTQQLARMLYESIGFEKTIVRKVKELLTALQIERMYTKSEIAEMYLNSNWMGHGVYGVQAAAQRFFDKNSNQLTPDECALLAGVIKNSARFSPIRNPINAYKRRNLVLHRMRKHGYLTDEEYALYKNTPLQVFKPEPPAKQAPYFVEYIRQRLQRENEKLGIDIYRDGLSIYTTIDSKIQAAADSAMNQHLRHQQELLNTRLLEDLSELRSFVRDSAISLEQVRAMIRGDIPMNPGMQATLVVQGALVAINPANGHILALIGGRDFNESEFNRATQARRQPGSAFKPIVFATAIDNGFPVTTQLLNQPVVLNMPDGTRWAPKNYDLSTGGNTTLREGLAKSLNLISVRVVQELISPASVVELAKRMHMTTKILPVDALALGACEVIPIELASAFGIFENHGVWVEPIAIIRIKDRYGNTIAQYNPRQELVLSEETAYLTTSLLESAVNNGTGVGARSVYGFRLPAAGKTGTTNNFNDAWFIGFTPYMVAGVWVGVDNPAISLGNRQSGAAAALPVWANFMREAHKAKDWGAKSFQKPDGIVEVQICSETKLLPSQYCPLETEVFTKQTVPTEHCQIHKEIGEPLPKDNVVF
ncbi:MAG: PBP1A family penicillin-binding protein [Candidatus Marinimicrobia bacterium]|jgi:penicillin-binding protein 1A|nr:PBP1A family penicillin-binding protein [Candidatus Neomarinimicrobiota bacterium]MCK9560450.1 PBP1A family penicillin-binding protein [Candidatus Neomarinimicrobiota bacterium]